MNAWQREPSKLNGGGGLRSLTCYRVQIELNETSKEFKDTVEEVSIKELL